MVVPITAVGVTVVNLIQGQVEQRQFDRLQQASGFARRTLLEAHEQIARSMGRKDEVDRAVAAGDDALAATLKRLLDEQNLDFAFVVDQRGSVLARAAHTPRFAAGVPSPTDEEVVAGQAHDRALVARDELDTSGHELVVGQWLDSDRLTRILRVHDVTLVLVDGRRVIASTGPGVALPDKRLEGAFRADIGRFESLFVADDVPGTSLTLLAVSPESAEARPTSLIVILGLVLVVVLVLIVLVGYVVSGLVTGPVQDLVGAAHAVARGDLEQRVDVKGDVEIAALGRAFNRMTDNLREYVHQLEQSRTEFRQAITRLGDVLVSTHDLPGIIDVVLDASALILRADVAVFYERVAMPAKLRATDVHGGHLPGSEINGTGIAGAAARQLHPVTFPGPVSLDRSEPVVDSALAVPVVSEGRLFGVLAVYGRQDGGAFSAEDIDTLQTLARQFEVAIGNVMLHDETKRQARTDDMTALWNRREFELRCGAALKEAARFNNPFGIILVDIDDFKQVNDRYDHSTGDAALVWVASRLMEATREVDVVARWGGEEFTVLLPRAGVEETARVAERVRKAVAKEPMIDDDKVIPLTVSVGYAVHPEDGRTADQLIRAADAGLYQAKRLGKNRVERQRGGAGGTITALGAGR